MFYTGVVENRLDPLKLGRCQVRISGLHTEDKTVLPTASLPWAHPLQPITSAAMNGIGYTPVGPVEGTWVMIVFRDEDKQMPIMVGTMGGIPQSKAAEKNSIDGKVMTGQEYKNADFVKKEVGEVSSSLGNLVKSTTSSAKSAISGVTNAVSNAIGSALSGTALGSTLSSFGINFGGKATVSLPTIASVPIPKDITGVDGNTETKIPQRVDPTDKAVAPTAQATEGNPTALSTAGLKTDIPTKPLPKYASNPGKQEECIKAIIAACDVVGLNHKYAKCSILGICGGESSWLPVEEGHNYSADALLKVFPGVFKGDTAKAQQYARWQGSKADFFREIYSPKYKNGQGAGNKEADDGAKYYGRGFNQITGRSLYEQLTKELKKYGGGDIAKNPDLLISDITTSALATVLFYKINVKHDPSSPGYFEAALKRTGNPVGASYEKKKVMYQYFLGEGVIPDSSNKTTGEGKTYSQSEVQYLPKSQQDRLLENRTENSTTGFLDPNGKYPLRNLLDEPDTNRLARGIIKETSIEFKDATRTTGISTANDADGTWEQPLAPFGGEYPYAKMYESESGHVMTFDDSPGHENIGLYHRKGSFMDIDANGTMVHKIVGDGYVIMDRNGFITIAGKCNIHVGGDANILVDGSADVEVTGSTNANFHNVVNLGCAADVNWAIGGDLNLQVTGKFNTTVKGSINTTTSEGLNLQATKDIVQKASKSIKLDGKESITEKSEGAIKIDAKGDFAVVTKSAMKLTSSGSAVNIKASANVNIDGNNLKMQQGSAQAAEGFDGVAAFTGLSLTAPAVTASPNSRFDPLVAPVRPSPEVVIKTDLDAKFNRDLEDFQKNPNKYYSAEAEAAGVNANRPPQPNVGDAGQSLRSGAEAADIQSFLQKQIALAKEGYWSETGMNGGASNPNIIAMWKDLGLGSIGKNDQVAWCMAFVNWTLKQCNYRYVQSARAFDLRDKPERWGATKVTDPQPGDIVIWSYSHVNFVYDVKGSNIICCGGNQGGGKVTNNNPTGGSVTISYPNGVSKSNGSIVGIYRPSKS